MLVQAGCSLCRHLMVQDWYILLFFVAFHHHMLHYMKKTLSIEYTHHYLNMKKDQSQPKTFFMLFFVVK